MRIFNLNRIAKYCNKATDADGIGATSVGDGGQWEMGQLAFIDDDEQAALGIIDPLDKKPATLESELEKGAKLEADDDAEDEDEDAEEEDAEDEDEDAEEEDAEDEDEDEDDEDDEDEDEDDEDEDEDDEAGKKAKRKPAESSAVAGLKKEISRLRSRAQAAENVKAKAEARAAVLEKQVREEIPTLRAELKALIKQRNAATLDEDTDAMTEADMAADEVRAKIARIEQQADSVRERAGDAQAEIDAVIEEAAIKACSTYPVLNPESTTFDPRLVDMINSVYSSNLAKKMPVIDAFEQALEGVMELTGNAPKGTATDPKTAKKRDAAQARRKEAAKATPRTTTGKQRGAESRREGFVFKASDFSTNKGRKKLQSELGIIIPR